ncbi:hypothetical protein ACAY42_004315 [Citrobacter freundii]|uniref:hypothetical protein n=1 Tax=Citrobacter freundii complex TaxID=1344959 RepID=UPI001576E0D0|nr:MULTISPECIES: hypothetical protein [Citrobacter freundii complex]EJG2200437.1 hypothetical protein [Citrobacter freundii]ELG9925198.1 hypothetical protein [Citrobacter freundii]ELK6405076.1 hypothetical protein [Citrobacter freundii]ELS5416923.1 hypothetical protein [Citrobacter freundii]ELT9552944.1 hypothetical protein [Citrobacter freundii]
MAQATEGIFYQFFHKAKNIQFMRRSLQVVIRLYQVTVVTILRCEMGHSFGENGFRK